MHQVLLESKTADFVGKGKGKTSGSPWVEIGSSEDATGLPKVVYEINTDSDHFEPRLRVIVSTSEDQLSSFPSFVGSPNTHNVVEPPRGYIEPVEDDASSPEEHLATPSTSRGRDYGSSEVKPRSHSTSPEPISTYVYSVPSLGQFY